MDNIFIVIFEGIEYKLVFTNHGLLRMQQRGINIEMIIESIEKYDLYYENYFKKVVEKRFLLGNIRTVFDINKDNIILITSMYILGK